MGIIVERDGVCARVTLDWPERRNAMGPEASREFAAAVRESAADPDIKAVVITGNGAFSAGGDLRGMIERKDMDPEERRAIVYSGFQGVVTTLVDLPVPTFAAIDGPAVGFGLDIAMACDWRFFGPDGWCRQGWAGLGLLPGTGGELLLRLKAPNALWQILPGQRKVDADLAVRLGLGERAEPNAVEVALARAKALEPVPREVVGHYALLSRSALRQQLPQYLEGILDLQLPLLTAPGFGARAEASLSGGGHALTSSIYDSE